MEVYVDDMLVGETFDTLRKYRIRLNLAKCVFGVSLGMFLRIWYPSEESKPTWRKLKPYSTWLH